MGNEALKKEARTDIFELKHVERPGKLSGTLLLEELVQDQSVLAIARGIRQKISGKPIVTGSALLIGFVIGLHYVGVDMNPLKNVPCPFCKGTGHIDSYFAWIPTGIRPRLMDVHGPCPFIPVFRHNGDPTPA